MDADRIFDWANQFSDRAQKIASLREAKNMLFEHRRCGQCDNWMKSSQCPREVNIKGRNHGPSCKAFPCETFVESAAAIKQRESLEIKVSKLTKELS